jgi:hypothetical protein
MNKEAIALAADSALTLQTQGKPKIFTSANKIFALSKYHPVGIMVYGNANFMEIPWEIIIKIFRNKIGDKSFDTLEEYAEYFMNFLKNEKKFFSDIEQEKFVINHFYSYLNMIKNDILQEIEKKLRINETIDNKEIKKITSEHIQKHYDEWKESNILTSISEDQEKEILKKYKSKFSGLSNRVGINVFDTGLPLKKASKMIYMIFEDSIMSLDMF